MVMLLYAEVMKSDRRKNEKNAAVRYALHVLFSVRGGMKNSERLEGSFFASYDARHAVLHLLSLFKNPYASPYPFSSLPHQR